MCLHQQQNTGKTPEGMALREIEKRVMQGAMRADRRRTEKENS